MSSKFIKKDIKKVEKKIEKNSDKNIDKKNINIEFNDDESIKYKDDKKDDKKMEKKGFIKKNMKTDKKKLEEKNDQFDQDTIFTLTDVNLSVLDKTYVLSEITKKHAPHTNIQSFQNIPPLQNSQLQHLKSNKSDDIKSVTTSLEKLGISNVKKEATETIYWGDNYEINLFCNNENIMLKDISINRKCSNCHQYPPIGSLMIIVPYKYVSSYIEDYVYAPECINVVKGINVDLSKEDRTKKHDPKTAPKVNYFRRDIPDSKKELYKDRLINEDYFEGSELVCSFPCCFSRGRELSIIDAKYKNSDTLIYRMYKKIFKKLPTNIKPAAHFTTLKEYGGPYTIEEYRKNFEFLSLEDTNQHFSIANKIMNVSSKISVITKHNTKL